MPESKQMKIQWMTVNGRSTPLVLPQTYSYAKNDWVVTSDQDPLPVVEYGTTEGGIIVPKRVSDEGHELTQVTGSNVEDEQALPVKTVGVKSTYIDLIDSPVTILPEMSYATSIIDLTDCSDMTLAVRVQGSKKWRAIWQNRTKSGSGLAATHLIERRESAAPYDAKRESLKTPYGYAVVTNGEAEQIVVESISIVKWVVGGENNGA